jgi:hypothetical protein
MHDFINQTYILKICINESTWLHLFETVIKILVLPSIRPSPYYMMILLPYWINACVEYQ